MTTISTYLEIHLSTKLSHSSYRSSILTNLMSSEYYPLPLSPLAPSLSQILKLIYDINAFNCLHKFTHIRTQIFSLAVMILAGVCWYHCCKDGDDNVLTRTLEKLSPNGYKRMKRKRKSSNSNLELTAVNKSADEMTNPLQVIPGSPSSLWRPSLSGLPKGSILSLQQVFEISKALPVRDS
jgi:hypothetical protein